jgi:hypothetical protein
MNKIKPGVTENNEKVVISRGKAIKRLGLITLSAASMMLLLNEPAKGQDSDDSPENPPDWP